MKLQHLLSVISAGLISTQLTPAWALECKVVEAQPEIISRIPESPSWFTKVHASGDYAFYIGGGNKLLYLEDSNPDTRTQQIPGFIDPVPSSDGRIVTIPGLKIYLIDDVLRDGVNAQPLISDSEHGGVYQSVAVLSQSATSATYRVITDLAGVRYRDYQVDYSVSPPRAEALGQVDSLCPGRTYKTIMVSKTSRYVGVYDPGTGTSKLVTGDGQCREVLDLGYPTGKIEFSFDEKRIAFHVDYFDTDAGGYFSGVKGILSKDVFVLDIEEQGDVLVGSNLRRLGATWKKGSGGYYPSFDKYGRVVYAFDDSNVFSFHVINPDDLTQYDFVLPPPEGWLNGPPPGTPSNWKERLHAAAALGSMWFEECRTDDADDLTAVDAASNVLAISQADCEELASRWDTNRQRIAIHPRFSRDTRFDSTLVESLDAVSLQDVCRDNRPTERVTRVYGQEVREVLDGPRVLQNYCVGCHDGPSLRQTDGSLVPNALNFEKLTETQILASLARIALPEGAPLRMPPGRGYFTPPFTLDGQRIDHREVGIAHLEELLAQVRQDPEPLAAVNAPSGSGCFGTIEAWLAYRDDIAYRASQGQFINYREIDARLEQCATELQNLQADECLENLKNYSFVRNLPFGRRLDFEMTDIEYYRSIPQDAVSMPIAGEGIDLTDGIPTNWEELVAFAPNVRALQYRSRTVVNPGNAGSLNRLLFLVEGDRYDKWVQFTLPEPNTNVPDSEFDPTGFIGGTGPERLVDFIAVDKSFSPPKIYFAQFWRDRNGRNPRPRLRAYREAYGMSEISGDVNTADTCYSCHPNGMRRISPQPASVTNAAAEVLEYFNAKMAGYTKRAAIDWHEAIHPEYYGPPLGEQVGCVSCHNNGEPGTVQALRMAPITYKLSRSHLEHKVTGDLSMPVESYVYDASAPDNPIAASTVEGYLRSTNFVVDDLRVSLSKEWISRQTRGSSDYPAVGNLIDDLAAVGVFDLSYDALFPEGSPYLSPSMITGYSVLNADGDRLASHRQTLLNRMQGRTRTQRQLGRWLQQACLVDAIP